MTEDDKPSIAFTSSTDQWKTLKPFARTMRHVPTPAEQQLWEHLRNRGLSAAKFRRQHAIDGFSVDFVCIEHKVIVELDGAIHDEPTQKVYDEARQEQIEEQGFRVLRFRNQQVFERLDEVIEAIKKALTFQ
jgi:phosphoribosylformylglycinamidine synthase subunit PurQ / glutaminase